MNHRVLITGGTGFIGSHLTDTMIREGYEVIVLDDLSSGKLENIKPHFDKANLHFIKGDVRDKKVVREALRDIEAVFHLAAITSVPYSIRNPDVTHDVNSVGTMNLLEASSRGDVKRFIYASTCAVYGEAEYLPVDEKHLISPISPYAKSKFAAEKHCKEFQKAYGLNTTVLRFFNVYGSRMQNNQYGGVIMRFIERLRSGKPPVIYGDGSQTRDFVHVADIVGALRLALSSGNAVGRTLNIGTGVPTTINHLAQLLIRTVGFEEVGPQYQNAREGDIRHSYADIGEAKAALGYEPKVFLKDGLLTLVGEDVVR